MRSVKFRYFALALFLSTLASLSRGEDTRTSAELSFAQATVKAAVKAALEKAPTDKNSKVDPVLADHLKQVKDNDGKPLYDQTTAMMVMQKESVATYVVAFPFAMPVNAAHEWISIFATVQIIYEKKSTLRAIKFLTDKQTEVLMGND